MALLPGQPVDGSCCALDVLAAGSGPCSEGSTAQGLLAGDPKDLAGEKRDAECGDRTALWLSLALVACRPRCCDHQAAVVSLYREQSRTDPVCLPCSVGALVSSPFQGSPLSSLQSLC